MDQPHVITTSEVEANIGVTDREVLETVVTGLTAALMKIHELEAQVQQLQWDLEDQAANHGVAFGHLKDRIHDLEDHR
jgi:hypothetical protein